MKDHVKKKVEEWLCELESERDALQNKVETREKQLDVLKAKFNIIDNVSMSVKKLKVYKERYLNPVEEEIDTLEKEIDKESNQDREKILELDKLIEEIKKVLEQVEHRASL